MNSPKDKRSFPKLSILNSQYCSQEMVDRIIDYLSDKHPDVFDILYVVDHGYPNGAVISAYGKIAQFIKDTLDGKVELPDSAFGYIALQFEICRRYRESNNLPLPALRGHSLPLTESLYDVLPERKINARLLAYGISQNFVDSFVVQYCLDFPLWIRLQAEAFRRDVAPFSLDRDTYPSMDYFRRHLGGKTEEKNFADIVRELRVEVADRIRLACDIL
ncbi:MAG: hypothetical protein ACK4PK_00565 [Alphaproteobacteria bacterium]